MAVRRTDRIMALAVAGCLVALLSSGCAYSGSSLATNSGPKPHGGPWSVAREQWVHVGEQIDVSYALYGGAADYAVLNIDPLGKSRVSLAADRGRFVFENLRFSEPTPPERPLLLQARAFRERGERDVMDLDGKLLRRESPYDNGDQKIASATFRIHVYQSNLAIPIPAEAGGYKWETGKLLLYADPERPAEVRQGRDYRKGFHVDGPTATGSFVVAYEPAADQVKRTDLTRVVFTVLDTTGNEHRQEIWLPTP